MTLQQLHQVITIAESRSMNEASRKLFVSQPNLSAVVRELEEEAGITIFIRSNRGIVLTPEGEEFIGYAKQVVEQYHLLESRYISSASKKKFSVSMQHYTFAVKAFVEVVKAVGMDEYEFAVHETQTNQVIENVRNMKSELGILFLSKFNEAVLQKLFKENDVIFAEAMTIWHMPLYKKLWELIDAGKTGTYASNANEEHEEIADWLADGVPALGKVQMIQLNFGSYKEYNMKNRFFNMDLAGGALLDIGVYALSIARSFMESKPDQVLSQVKFAPTGADEQAGILLMNKEAQMATLALSLHSKQPKRAVISCENGYIEIMEYPRADQAVIVEAESGVHHTVNAGEAKKALSISLSTKKRRLSNIF